MRPVIPSVGDHALFLDFEDVIATPAEAGRPARPFPAVALRLEALRDRFGGALAILSSCTIGELDRALAPAQFAAAGLDGLERRYDHVAEIDRPVAFPPMDTLRSKIIASDLIGAGVWLEDRGPVLAIHYDGAPHREAAILAFLEAQLQGTSEMHLVYGRWVVETRPKGARRCHAVDAFLDRPGFVGRRPVYVFAGGREGECLDLLRRADGILVGLAPSDHPDGVWLDGTDGLVTWLDAILATDHDRSASRAS